ncbi:MAG: alpha/beta hydrolase [Actinomycetota bacterium]|nr:alpha/beta hydrolase [Actinomycetota bacterium]
MDRWREGYVAGGDTRFFVRALGHGPDLAVLLHGWPETGRAWHRVAPLLVDAGYRVACPDLKGFGRSDAPRRGYDSRTLADEISRLIRALHVRKAILVGHDWGGAVALATAFRHPGRVRALVIANSPYRQVELRHAWHIPMLNVPVLPELAFRLQADRLVPLVLRYASRTREAFPDEVVDEYVEAVQAAPGGWLSYYRTLPRRAVADAVTTRVRRRVPGLTAPTGPHRLRVPAAVVWGEDDPVMPVRVGRRAADQLGADLVVVPGVGHFPHEEHPRAFAQAVLDLTGPAPSRDAQPEVAVVG